MNARRLPGWAVLMAAMAWLGCGDSVGSSGGTGGHGGGASGGANGGTGGGVGGFSTVAATGGTTATSSGSAAGGAGGTTTAATATGGASGGAGGTGTTFPQVAGGPCSTPGEQSPCASAGTDPCRQCLGSWLYCANGRWQVTHCDPVIDAGRDVALDSPPDAAPPIDVEPNEVHPIDTAAAETPSIDGPSVLRGYLVYAFEVMAFEACGTTKVVWANLQGWEKGIDLLPSPGPYCVTTDAGVAPCPGSIYVELVGTLSPVGRYGHLGQYSQELRVTEFLAASSKGPADCPFLSPQLP